MGGLDRKPERPLKSTKEGLHRLHQEGSFSVVVCLEMKESGQQFTIESQQLTAGRFVCRPISFAVSAITSQSRGIVLT